MERKSIVQIDCYRVSRLSQSTTLVPGRISVSGVEYSINCLLNVWSRKRKVAPSFHFTQIVVTHFILPHSRDSRPSVSFMSHVNSRGRRGKNVIRHFKISYPNYIWFFWLDLILFQTEEGKTIWSLVIHDQHIFSKSAWFKNKLKSPTWGLCFHQPPTGGSRASTHHWWIGVVVCNHQWRPPDSRTPTFVCWHSCWHQTRRKSRQQKNGGNIKCVIIKMQDYGWILFCFSVLRLWKSQWCPNARRCPSVVV